MGTAMTASMEILDLLSSYPYQRCGNSYDLFGSGKKGSDVDMKAWSSLGNRDDRDLI
jgi:hypothetical protein